MESVHFVGIAIILWMVIYYFVITNQLDRMEEKLNKLLKDSKEERQ